MPAPTTPAIPTNLSARRKTRVYDILNDGVAAFFDDLIAYLLSPYVGGVIVGEIKMTINPTPPEGWLCCDGSTFDAADYPDLFAFLGTNILPNYADRHPIGAGAIAIGAVGGSATATLTSANIPTHTHGFTADPHSHSATATPHAHTYDQPSLVSSPDLAAGLDVASVEIAAGNTADGSGAITIDQATISGVTDSTGGGEAFGIAPPAFGVCVLIFAGQP